MIGVRKKILLLMFRLLLIIEKYTYIICKDISSVQLLSHVPLFCDPMDYSMLGLPVHHHLPELAQTHVHWVSHAFQPSHPLSSPSLLPSIFPSIRVFSNESVLYVRWPKYWSFSFRISSSNDYSGLVSFRIDWFDLLAVQGALKSTYILQRYKYTYITCIDSVLFSSQRRGCSTNVWLL